MDYKAERTKQDDERMLAIAEEYENKIVWLLAWMAVANSNSTINPKTPGEWADDCLEQYQNQFHR